VNTIYALYGDPAYPQSPYLIGGALSVAGSVKTSWSKSVSGGPPRGGKGVRQDFAIFQLPVAKYYTTTVSSLLPWLMVAAEPSPKLP
jgi:hypothetical protein